MYCFVPSALLCCYCHIIFIHAWPWKHIYDYGFLKLFLNTDRKELQAKYISSFFILNVDLSNSLPLLVHFISSCRLKVLSTVLSHFNWRTPFSISCKAGMLVRKSLCFVSGFLGKCITFFFVERKFCWCRILGRKLFFQLSMLAYCFSDSIISEEKSVVNLIEDPCKWWVAFLSSSFLVFGCITIYSMIIIDLSAYLWVYPTGFLWISLICRLMIFIKFGKISDIIFSNIISVHFSICLPSENPIMCMLVWLVVS